MDTNHCLDSCCDPDAALLRKNTYLVLVHTFQKKRPFHLNQYPIVILCPKYLFSLLSNGLVFLMELIYSDWLHTDVWGQSQHWTEHRWITKTTDSLKWFLSFTDTYNFGDFGGIWVIIYSKWLIWVGGSDPQDGGKHSECRKHWCELFKTTVYTNWLIMGHRHLSGLTQLH